MPIIFSLHCHQIIESLTSELVIFHKQKLMKVLIATLSKYTFPLWNFVLTMQMESYFLSFRQTMPSGSLFIFPRILMWKPFSAFSVSYLDASISLWYIIDTLTPTIAEPCCICCQMILMMTNGDLFFDHNTNVRLHFGYHYCKEWHVYLFHDFTM